MRRNYKDYTIETRRICHPTYDMGITVDIYVAKDSGMKENIHTFATYNRHKNHADAIEMAKRFIDYVL